MNGSEPDFVRAFFDRLLDAGTMSIIVPNIKLCDVGDAPARPPCGPAPCRGILTAQPPACFRCSRATKSPRRAGRLSRWSTPSTRSTGSGGLITPARTDRPRLPGCTSALSRPSTGMRWQVTGNTPAVLANRGRHSSTPARHPRVLSPWFTLHLNGPVAVIRVSRTRLSALSSRSRSTGR